MNDALAALSDIVEPAAPLLAQEPQYWVYILLVGIALGFLLAIRRVARIYRAQQRLRRLRREFAAGKLDPHATAFLLAAEVRRVFHLKHLTEVLSPPALSEPDAVAWREFATCLDRLRYQPDSRPGAHDVTALFDQALSWARRYPC